jgi:hypothetical protein
MALAAEQLHCLQHHLVPNGFGSGTSITLSTGAGKVDMIQGKLINSHYYWTVVKDFQ